MTDEFAYTESDLLPLSGLQHIVFCERQCALIHLEREWVENRHTAEGRQMHERAHSDKHETRKGVRTRYGLALRSLALGVSGQADVVEFHKDRVIPVEYKRGREKKNDCDRVQLCAQAICLEEMLDAAVPEGFLFYGKTRRRRAVTFDADLRRITREAAVRFHDLFRHGKIPPPIRIPGCATCSFLNRCMPDLPGNAAPVAAYLDRMLPP